MLRTAAHVPRPDQSEAKANVTQGARSQRFLDRSYCTSAKACVQLAFKFQHQFETFTLTHDYTTVQHLPITVIDYNRRSRCELSNAARLRIWDPREQGKSSGQISKA
jgi:hypothetical protein